MPSISYHDAVNEALERMDDLGYERGAGVDLANHGPMGAEALAVLGYEGEVAGWVERYRVAMPHHEPPAARFPLDPDDESSWRPALGAFDRAGDWERLFARELAGAPWRDVLARWWPRLLPGLFAGLTHGLIRTAHAVRALYGAADGKPTQFQLAELARGLAYWAARYTALPGQARLRGSYDLAGAIAALPRVPGDGGPMHPGVARGRLARLADLPGYAEALDALAVEHAPYLLSEMTAQFSDVYLSHDEVFPVPLIHGVTAPAAARLVLPHLPADQYEPTLAALWQVHTALLLAFTTSRRGEGTGAWQAELSPEPGAEPPSLDELSARAVEHGDEHVLKFTEACRREYALRPDPRFRAAVAVAQRRIAPLGK
ncbi:hypothetical protein DMH18_39705 [Streptomyces sp. WAC 06783]|uniref:questin oxidase family protein n=1 Tax=Streptomyces sp. WAC 06783 TaxID=2203211 RepID=UPI000F735C53|nr:questin oxidase family protein [Streptomyces sp. WAC 06783]RSO02863.1 hypothetical protein DMH18_39705 [Streptomyces sp. WAC 06783]